MNRIDLASQEEESPLRMGYPPYLEYFLITTFEQFGHHGNHSGTLLPHQAPKLVDGRAKRPLGDNVFIHAVEALPKQSGQQFEINPLNAEREAPSVRISDLFPTSNA
jgi:hypothetical protein